MIFVTDNGLRTILFTRRLCRAGNLDHEDDLVACNGFGSALFAELRTKVYSSTPSPACAFRPSRARDRGFAHGGV